MTKIQTTNNEQLVFVKTIEKPLVVNLKDSVVANEFEDVVLTFDDNVISTNIISVLKVSQSTYKQGDRALFLDEDFDNGFVYFKNYDINTKKETITLRNYGSILLNDSDYYEMALSIIYIDKATKFESTCEKKIVIKYKQDTAKPSENATAKIRSIAQPTIINEETNLLYATRSAKIESLKPKTDEVPILSVKIVPSLIENNKNSSTIKRIKQLKSSDILETSNLNNISIACDVFGEGESGIIELFGLDVVVTSSAYWCNPIKTIKKEPITLNSELVPEDNADVPCKETTTITFQITDKPMVSRTSIINISIVDFPNTSFRLFVKNTS